MRRRSSGLGTDGSVALEAVLVAPVVALVVLLVLGLAAPVVAALDARAAAQTAARVAVLHGARAAHAAAAEALPGADVVVLHDGAHVRVRVTVDHRVLGREVTTAATAVAAREP